MDAPVTHGRADAWKWAVAFFTATYVVTALFWVPILRSGQPFSALQDRLQLLLLLATIVPSVVAIEGGGRGLRELLGQVGQWRFGLGWYALALLLMPLVWLVALIIGRLWRPVPKSIRATVAAGVAPAGPASAPEKRPPGSAHNNAALGRHNSTRPARMLAAGSNTANARAPLRPTAVYFLGRVTCARSSLGGLERDCATLFYFQKTYP